MTKKITTFLILLCSQFIFGQNETNLVSKSFVKKDTIFLRFGAPTPQLLIDGLNNGYKVERFIGSDTTDIDSKTESIIPSAQSILDQFEASGNERKIDIFNIITSFINSDPNDLEAQQMLLVLLSLSSSVDKDFLTALGLLYVDSSIDKNKIYTYRISINYNESDTNATIITVNANEKDESPDFKTLTYEKRIKFKAVYLRWEAKELNNSYAGYWIERSIDGKHFTKLTETPLQFFTSSQEPNKTHIDFVDQEVTTGETYFYKVRAINHFAQLGGESNIIKVYIHNNLKGDVRIDTVFADGFNRTISGYYNSEFSKDKDLVKEFLVYRSDSMFFGYKQVKVDNQLELPNFKFNVPSPIETGERYYYKVGAVSADNDTVYSFHSYFFTYDQKPPEIPTGLKGTINENGILDLNWDENPDKDIRGFRVFKANALNEEFVEVTTDLVVGLKFNDTLPLNTLTSEIYYKIRAVDLNWNNSPLCEPVKILKPDTIPPVPCSFKRYKVNKTGVLLSWNNSSSTDVDTNILIRTNFTTKMSEIIYKWSDTTAVYEDTTTVVGTTYIYHISTSDEQPNTTISDKVSINYETGIRPAVTDFKSEVNRENKTIILTWSQDNTNIYSCKIYRSKGDSKFRLHKTIAKPENNEFTDTNLYINNTYKYKIKVVYSNGINSKFSKVIEVNF